VWTSTHILDSQSFWYIFRFIVQIKQNCKNLRQMAGFYTLTSTKQTISTFLLYDVKALVFKCFTSEITKNFKSFLKLWFFRRCRRLEMQEMHTAFVFFLAIYSFLLKFSQLGQLHLDLLKRNLDALSLSENLHHTVNK